VAAAISWQFTLLREITQTFGYAGGGNFDGAHGGTFAEAGDNSANREVRGFLSYDISALPAGITTIESATLSTHVAGVLGKPFGLFGNMLIQSVSYASIDQTAFDSPPLHDLGVFIAATGSNATGDAVSKDVLAALKDDYANRVSRNQSSQYKLLFSSAPNADASWDAAYVQTAPSTNTLTVTYLYP
jgi:hypothetical protein